MKTVNIKTWEQILGEAKNELESYPTADRIAVPVFANNWDYTHHLFGDEVPRSKWCIIFNNELSPIFTFFEGHDDSTEIINNPSLAIQYDMVIQSYRHTKHIIASIIEDHCNNDKGINYCNEFIEFIQVDNLKVFVSGGYVALTLNFEKNHGVCFVFEKTYWGSLKKHIIQ